MLLKILAGVFVVAAIGLASDKAMGAAAVCVLVAFLLVRKSRRKTGTKPRAKKQRAKQQPVKQVTRTVQPIQAAPMREPTAPAAPMREPTAPAAPAVRRFRTVYKGTVVGVSYDGRQQVLERLATAEMEGEMLTFELEESEYKGEPSIKVMAGTMDEGTMKEIGFVAAGDVARVLPYVGAAYVDGKVYGGDDGKNYGAAIEVFVAE